MNLDMQVLAKELVDIIVEETKDLHKTSKRLHGRIKSLEVRIRELEQEQLAPRVTQLEDLLTEPVKQP